MQNDFITIIVFLIFIIVGLLSVYRPTLEWMIKFRNSVRGVNTEITETTIIYHRIAGIITLVIGIFFLFMYVLK
jgi:uncharacterized protein YjeT (DUF2065 family)